MAMAMQVHLSSYNTTSSHINQLGGKLSSATANSAKLSSVFYSSTLSFNSVANPLTSTRTRRRPVTVRVSGEVGTKKKVLIVNTNSGGHAVIGFWFAKDLRSAGHQVTIFTVGEETSDKMIKPPFSRFSELRDNGVQTIWGKPAEIGTILEATNFDAVLDNNGKDLDYDLVKADASHVAVEDYIRSLSFNSWAIFRPQYIIGSGNNKDCEEWFFDRIVRDRPVPIPGSGVRLTNISHVTDLSSMLVLAVEKPAAASGNVFNAVSDRAITFDGLVRLCAKAAGREVNIIHYDPKSLGIDAKKAFPFRNMHFYAEPRTAKEILGWRSTTNLPEDLNERFAEYVGIGRDKKDMKFELDDKILESSSVAVTV